jgi:hypothetical protein
MPEPAAAGATCVVSPTAAATSAALMQAYTANDAAGRPSASSASVALNLNPEMFSTP